LFDCIRASIVQQWSFIGINSEAVVGSQ